MNGETPVKALIPDFAPRWRSAGAVLLAVAALSACSSGPKKPEPAPLPTVSAPSLVRHAWSLQVGEMPVAAMPKGSGTLLSLATARGVVVVDTTNGQPVWRAELGAAPASGVGFDGDTVAVVTRSNELVALAQGKELWRQRLPSSVLTPPLVAGQRVFVLAADRSVSAFDGQSGARLWSQPARGTEALVLQQPGVLTAVGDTLVAGIGGRLVGLNPSAGSVRWEVPLASPRGINEIERLVDVVGPVGRWGNQICARSFQANVGCVDAARGQLQWSKPAVGALGTSVDATHVYSVDGNGRVAAWQRSSGEPAWTNEQLMHRGLTAPLALDRHVIVGDAQGHVHWLASDDGRIQWRSATDGSAIVSAPVKLGAWVVAVTRQGSVYGWQIE